MKTLFLGDVCPTAATNHLFEIEDVSTLFTDSLPLFDGNDINFVNIEVALTESDKDIKKLVLPLRLPLRPLRFWRM